MINGAGPLHSFFNLYKAFPGVEKVQVVRGIPDEIIERMKQKEDRPDIWNRKRAAAMIR